MPRHDPSETQGETDARVERELRVLMAQHRVEKLIGLPPAALRQAAIDAGVAGSATLHRILLERTAS